MIFSRSYNFCIKAHFPFAMDKSSNERDAKKHQHHLFNSITIISINTEIAALHIFHRLTQSWNYFSVVFHSFCVRLFIQPIMFSLLLSCVLSHLEYFHSFTHFSFYSSFAIPLYINNRENFLCKYKLNHYTRLYNTDPQTTHTICTVQTNKHKTRSM